LSTVPVERVAADSLYPSRRAATIGKQMVATSQPLAAQAGLAVLAGGGNAVDAAITAAAVLTVVEPIMNGVGSDAFALVWDGQKLHGLNGSGRAPARFTLSRVSERSSMPALGWDAVTVPGAVHAWATLWARFGSRPFAELLAPAVAFAREGFPVAPVTAALWRDQAPRFAGFREFARVFLPGGRAPAAGETFRNPDLAATLEEIAATTGRSLYNGALAERIGAAAAADGGLLDARDMGDHRSTWVEPLAMRFGGVVLHELPPNGQGLASLMALGILERLHARRLPIDSADAIHLQLEAMKLAFAACRRQVADPEAMMIEPSALLEPDYLEGQARFISPKRVQVPDARIAPEHGTVYLATADARGRMVSFIQSNYLGFGSGVVVPGTGIALQNRALGFSLDPRHPNCVGGRKRPYHTIMPGFVTRGGKPAAAFGVMGGHMQPQGHVQMMMRMFAHGQNPQTACDAPRWYLSEHSDVGLEPGVGADVASDLAARGHRLMAAAPTVLFGGAQIIQRVGEVFWGGSDPRKDGQAIGI
jgi:gamma-glutamyltranspeptidase/glutathione hydrolase